jgi:hypothetical protein
MPQRRSPRTLQDEFDRIHDATILRAVKQITELDIRAERILCDYHERARQRRDVDAERNAYWMRIALAEMTGRGARAEKLLREQHERFPDLRSKLAILNHLTISRDNHREALALIRKIKLPKNPSALDVTNFYNVVVIQGKCEFYLKRFAASSRTMKRLADFTERNIDRIEFFFDVHFVAWLIQKHIALDDCRRYLEAIATRPQVRHDAKTTQQLLRRIGPKRRAKTYKPVSSR